MKLISCEKLEKSMVELQFSIDAETFKSAVNTAFKREGKKYAIPGFRKGKAPKAMIEKMYGKDLFQYDAINDLFPENYEAAVKGGRYRVVGRPDPEVVSMSEDEGATPEGQGRRQARGRAGRVHRFNRQQRCQDC